MKKIFNKFTKILLLVSLIISDLMTPIKVFAAEEVVTPKSGDVGINETVSENGTEVSVTKGSLDNPGDVMVTKTVRKNGEGKFTIEFEVKGRDVENTTTVTRPVYAVVVFDRSGSMEEYDYDSCLSYGWFGFCNEYEEVKFSAAVSGAKTFASALLEKIPNAQIGLVTFASTASVAKDFNSSLENDLSDADFGNPNGGTNLHAGLIEANRLLSDSNIPENAKKYVVIISDGEPTYYVNENGNNAGPGNSTDKDVYDNTKSMADTIKEYAEVFSIGYSLPSGEVYNHMTAANILENMATEDNTTEENYIKHYYDSNPEEVAAAFNDIATSISKVSAGSEATLTDNIGSNFSVDANSSDLITITGSSVSNTSAFDITEEGTKISFDVEINGDEADGWVNVNEGFTLTYTDANGEEKTITYGADEPQPQVYWERNTYNYVINYYKDEITNTSDSEHYLGTSGNLSAFNGETITLTDDQKNAHIITGYELSDSNVYTITIDKTKDNIISVLYEKKDLNYIVKYFFEEDNNTYNERENLIVRENLCKYGDEINALDKVLTNVPTGYVLDEDKTKENNNGIYTITENDTVVSVYYKKQKLTYDVKYLFEDLNGSYVELENISGKEDVEAKYGDEVSYSEHVLTNIPEGYLLDTVKNTEVNNGKYVIVNNDTTVYVYYKRTNNTFTVNYYFNGAFDEVYSYSNNAIYGSTLNASDYTLENVNNEHLEDKKNADNEDYFLDPNNSSNFSSITVGISDNTMSLYYISTTFEDNAEEIEKSTTTEVVTNVNQKVDYTITYKNTINNVREGDVITITIVDALPFEIDEENSELTSDNVTGVYNSANKTITWTFEETASEFTYVYEIEKTVSFKVLYKDFADISASENNNLVNTASGMTTINNKSTDGDTSDTAEVPVEIEGDLTVTYKTVGEEVFETSTTTEYAGTEYTTEEKEFFGYHLVEVNGDREGKYLANQTVTVEYIYDLNDGEITENEVTKTGPETISDINGIFEYTLKYTGRIENYVGKATLTLTDTLPYEIDEEKSSYDKRCSYNNGTITCTVEYDIEENTDINEEFELSLVFKNIDSDVITNKVNSKLELREVYEDDDDSVETEVLKGNLTVTYKTVDEEVFETSTTTEYAGTEYTTEEKEFFGYHLVEVNGDREGKYLANQTVTVEYIYDLNDGEITENEVTKTGPETISDINGIFEYTLKYTGRIENYVGKATLTLTDTLPYEIDEEKSSYDKRCSYNNGTITCTVEYDIEENTDINEEFKLNLVFKNIDSDVITNKVNSKLELREVYEDDDDSVETEVLKGEVFVSYIDEEGNILDSYSTIDFAGSEYTTEAEEFEGYTFKSSSDNTEGVYIANTTINVEYVYAKNIGTSEEVEEMPPQTGIEDISMSYIKYLAMALILLLFGKKKETKNN